ncbi:hypothetical protein X975_19925, partial [Stegodyphus mimosarum]
MPLWRTFLKRIGLFWLFFFACMENHENYMQLALSRETSPNQKTCKQRCFCRR